MTGTKTYKEQENEARKGKKRYIQRLVEEKEAKAELKEQLELFDKDIDENRTDERRPD